jgi:hypothetical protein
MDDESPFFSIERASDMTLLEKSTNCMTLPARLTMIPNCYTLLGDSLQ